MSLPIDNNVDWTAPAIPGGEQYGPGLAARPAQPMTPPPAPKPARSVLDKLLGDRNLTAYDSSGGDPYNATGRQFRR